MSTAHKYTVKKVTDFPVPSWFGDIPAGNGKTGNLFLQFMYDIQSRIKCQNMSQAFFNGRKAKMRLCH
jgi:hypothetical protein